MELINTYLRDDRVDQIVPPSGSDAGPYLTEREIQSLEPERLPTDGVSAVANAARIMAEAGCWADNQQMGMRWPIGCVALEITQRCNLDCTLCYLSEHSEAVKDLPIAEVFRRIDLIRRHYGPATDVQITGGEPTLRLRHELVSIVRRAREAELRPTLMTNGQRATRSLLEELAGAGLMDVAFHIDMTQNRAGYRNEVELNALRAEYLDRVNGLPLSVMFNTTVHDQNFEDIPALVRFFAAHAGRIRTASFQVQAATGRGVHEKKRQITLDMVEAQISAGAGTAINFGSSLVGHPGCNRYGLCLCINGQLYDLLDDRSFIARMQQATCQLVLNRVERWPTIRSFLKWIVSHPLQLARMLAWTWNKLRQIGAHLFAARGRAHTLSFLVHGFMDACSLERDRIHACVFKTMTSQGPISMCLHNARRDHFILRPLKLSTPAGERYWNPCTGALRADGVACPPPDPRTYGLKRSKGRLRKRWLGDRSAN